ncbi:MAG: class I SAM-dependent methyltransferase [Myxococcales bacterium]|nr:class I SAM-dependent methyltransferase [Myxococcales bacterium]
MDRVVEPELMDDDAQARAYSEAGFAAPHERFVDLFVERFGTPRGRALDLGCGPADVTLRLARRCPELSIDGVDGSAAMLRYGRERIAGAGLEARVTLTEARLSRDPVPYADYDVVISNSLLHHLHDPGVLWAAVKQASRPGTRVFVMDLMRPASAEVVAHLVDEHARDEPEVLRRDFEASLFAAFTPGEIEAQLEAAGLGALRLDVVSDRHLTVSGRL